MFSLDVLASYIGMTEIPSSWQNCKEEINKTFKRDWLDNFEFNYMLSFYGFGEEFKNRFLKEIDLLRKNIKLNYITYLMYYILYESDEKDYYNIWSWKSTTNLFKKNGSYMIPIVALLCGYKIHIYNMEKRCFDEEQVKIQKYNIRLTCTSDKKRFNMDGIRFSQMIWGSFFIKGNLIQIGRLQYEIGAKDLSKLDKYFAQPHKYVYIHIPAGENLDYDEVLSSLNIVGSYIKKYFRELDDCKLAYYTHSWLLSPEVKEILHESSNIRKFQKLFKIIEFDEDLDDFLNFVFDETNDVRDFNSLKEKTSLQRGLKYKLLRGDKLHKGSGLLK